MEMVMVRKTVTEIDDATPSASRALPPRATSQRFALAQPEETKIIFSRYVRTCHREVTLHVVHEYDSYYEATYTTM